MVYPKDFEILEHLNTSHQEMTKNSLELLVMLHCPHILGSNKAEEMI